MNRRRAPERLLLSATACWQLGLAIVSLVPYRMWFEGEGQAALARGAAESSAGLVSELSGVLMTYGLILVIGALITGLIAWRLPQLTARTVIIWLAVCLVAAFVTTDFIGALLYSITLVFYVARARALAKVVALKA